MRMAEQDGGPNRRLDLFHHFDAERPHACAAIEDEAPTGTGDEFHARRIPAIAQCGWTRRGNGSPRAPKTNPHVISYWNSTFTCSRKAASSVTFLRMVSASPALAAVSISAPTSVIGVNP